MPRSARARSLVSAPPRVSAWLSDIEDWDADDADVFVQTLDRGPREEPVAEQTKSA